MKLTELKVGEPLTEEQHQAIKRVAELFDKLNTLRRQQVSKLGELFDAYADHRADCQLKTGIPTPDNPSYARYEREKWHGWYQHALVRIKDRRCNCHLEESRAMFKREEVSDAKVSEQSDRGVQAP